METQSAEIQAVRVVITGRVQGVWFRSWIKYQANQRDLVGWVRNRKNGTVEALFSGPIYAVDEIIKECLVGPPGADVTDIKKFPAEALTVQDFNTLVTL